VREKAHPSGDPQHGVLASHQPDVVVERLGEAVGDLGIHFQHAQARTVGHDLHVDISLAQVLLDVARVVEREIPFRRMAAAR